MKSAGKTRAEAKLLTGYPTWKLGEMSATAGNPPVTG
jgi:hypothetical protein